MIGLTAAAAPVSAKTIVICLDGTGNSPADKDEPGQDTTNAYRICNLVKTGKGTKKSQQIVKYFKGLATTGLKTFDRNARRFGIGGKHMRTKAYAYLQNHYQPGDKIFIFGFSRGAAIALDLANYIHKRGLKRLGLERLQSNRFAKSQSSPVKITFLGLWDTVGSFGFPFDILGLPTQQLNPGKDLSLPPNVEKVVHLLAIDERRDEFRPTLLPAAKHVEEVWFAGSHADVGGGFRRRRLADITLLFMIRRAREAGLQFDERRVRRIPKNRRGAGLIRQPASEISESLRKIRVKLERKQGPVSGSALPRRYRVPRIHNSVFAKMKWEKQYRPENVLKLEKFLIVE